MPQKTTTATQLNPAGENLRQQLLTIFRDSRQLKESSAQLRQRLVSAVFGTIQGQIDTARAERFAESEASKARKQGRATALGTLGLGGLVGAGAGALGAGAAGVSTLTGAGLGGLAGLGAGLGQGAASPAGALFTQQITNAPNRIAAQTALGNFFGADAATSNVATVSPIVASPATANQALSLPSANVLSPAAGVAGATNKIAQIAGLDNAGLQAAGNLAVQAGDRTLVELIAAEMKRRLGQ